MSDAIKRPIVDVGRAHQIGSIDGFETSMPAQVTGVWVRKGEAGNYLPWQSIKGFGSDAVTTDGPLGAREGEHREIIGQRVLTDQGFGLGTLQDGEFDASSGLIETIETSSGAVVPGRDVLGMGTYAVIVRHFASPAPGTAPLG
jgi:uncharacterized protein YrrD